MPFIAEHWDQLMPNRQQSVNWPTQINRALTTESVFSSETEGEETFYSLADEVSRYLSHLRSLSLLWAHTKIWPDVGLLKWDFRFLTLYWYRNCTPWPCNFIYWILIISIISQDLAQINPLKSTTEKLEGNPSKGGKPPNKKGGTAGKRKTADGNGGPGKKSKL